MNAFKPGDCVVVRPAYRSKFTEGTRAANGAVLVILGRNGNGWSIGLGSLDYAYWWELMPASEAAHLPGSASLPWFQDGSRRTAASRWRFDDPRGYEWCIRVVRRVNGQSQAWAVQERLESEGWTVLTPGPPLPSAIAPMADRLHACRPRGNARD